jgi:hypothetical protein
MMDGQVNKVAMVIAKIAIKKLNSYLFAGSHDGARWFSGVIQTTATV